MFRFVHNLNMFSFRSQRRKNPQKVFAFKKLESEKLDFILKKKNTQDELYITENMSSLLLQNLLENLHVFKFSPV